MPNKKSLIERKSELINVQSLFEFFFLKKKVQPLTVSHDPPTCID